MVTLAGGLATVPTVTTTGCSPSGALGGMVKLICVTPTNPEGMPTNQPLLVSTGTPPTVTDTGRTGLGSWFTVVRAEGVAPVASEEVTLPSPVMNMVMVCPRPADGNGFRRPSDSAKMPGAAEAIRRLKLKFAQGFPTVNDTCPAGVSYGIWMFTWVGET